MSCGCKIVKVQGKKLRGLNAYYAEQNIVFCPLHASAGILLEACKAILTNNVLVLFPEDDAMVKQAIARAEAKEAK